MNSRAANKRAKEIIATMQNAINDALNGFSEEEAAIIQRLAGAGRKHLAKATPAERELMFRFWQSFWGEMSDGNK